ncbi:sialate O-acetylesterase [Formosa haliotis]|uniref:sialate O-acetylesterase n=1 Tax=Formosa haliotis TaxID=1555194 RepID=UPI000825D987|nr:sialate O-acetylesterase [Formosa haliotis]
MLKTLFKYVSFLLVCALWPQYIWADVSVNPLFSDHMVIQRETKIPIWGWADPNEAVVVTGSWGKIAKTVTGADGTWRVDLQTPKAGGPFSISISGNNKIEINDVLSGEVWLCTGQSNMDFALEKFLNDAKEPQYQPLVDYIRAEVAQANDNQLRHIEVRRNTSLFEKQTTFKGAWVSATGEDVKKITATGYFFAKALRKALNVPVGLVECSWGGTRVQPWISEETYNSDPHLKAYFEANRKTVSRTIEIMDAPGYVDTLYQQNLATWQAKGSKGRAPKPTTHPTKNMQEPATLYNGMLNAIIPYAIKGAIWYQGESNAKYLPESYKMYFTAMIKGWRSAWGQGDFPFYWVQLAGCERGDKAANDGWAMVNNELRKSLDLPNTGMAVLHDIGEASDIHPHNKMDAGERLSLWALKNEYGITVEAVSGPLYKTFKVKQNKIQITFTDVASGLQVAKKQGLAKPVISDEPLSGFEILGPDGIWLPAQAKISAKAKIEVWNDSISQPKAVRYAWTGFPDKANLYNSAGLPAAVFSTEQ